MSQPRAAATAGAADSRPSVTVLAGFWPAATMAVARALLVADPDRILIRHDLSGVLGGVVHRVVRTGAAVLEDERVSLVHGCVSCTLREDVLPCLVRLAQTHPGSNLILVLPEVVEPETVAEAAARCLVNGRPVGDAARFDSFVTVADARHLMDDLTTTDDLADRSMHAAPDDLRSVAVVVSRQVEFADTVVLWGQPSADPFETERCAVVLHRLAPWATHVRAGQDMTGDIKELARQLGGLGRHQRDSPAVLARGLAGHLVGAHEPEADCGVVSAVFRARRPFHPQRLFEALGDIIGDVLRSRGHLWLASQPDKALCWESGGGGLGMGSLGQWLATLPEQRWDEASDQRRLTAAANWDPYYGDRDTHLAFIGIGLDPARLHDQLNACLLTDAEISLGENGWRALPDPFAGRFDESSHDTDPATNQPTAEQRMHA